MLTPGLWLKHFSSNVTVIHYITFSRVCQPLFPIKSRFFRCFLQNIVFHIPSLSYPREMTYRLHLDKERNILDDQGRILQSVPPVRCACEMADRIFQRYRRPFKGTDIAFRNQKLSDHTELKGPHDARLIDGIPALLRRQLPALYHLVHDLPQVDIHPLIFPKAQPELHTEHVIRPHAVHAVFPGIGLIRDGNAHKPVCIGTLWLLVKDGIQNISVQLIFVAVLCDEDQIVGQQLLGTVIF